MKILLVNIETGIVEELKLKEDQVFVLCSNQELGKEICRPTEKDTIRNPIGLIDTIASVLDPGGGIDLIERKESFAWNGVDYSVTETLDTDT